MMPETKDHSINILTVEQIKEKSMKEYACLEFQLGRNFLASKVQTPSYKNCTKKPPLIDLTNKQKIESEQYKKDQSLSNGLIYPKNIITTLEKLDAYSGCIKKKKIEPSIIVKNVFLEKFGVDIDNKIDYWESEGDLVGGGTTLYSKELDALIIFPYDIASWYDPTYNGKAISYNQFRYNEINMGYVKKNIANYVFKKKWPSDFTPNAIKTKKTFFNILEGLTISEKQCQFTAIPSLIDKIPSLTIADIEDLICIYQEMEVVNNYIRLLLDPNHFREILTITQAYELETFTKKNKYYQDYLLAETILTTLESRAKNSDNNQLELINSNKWIDTILSDTAIRTIFLTEIEKKVTEIITRWKVMSSNKNHITNKPQCLSKLVSL